MTLRALCLIMLTPSFAGGLLATQAARAQEQSVRASARSVQESADIWSRDNLPSLPIVQTAGKPSSNDSVSAKRISFALPAPNVGFRIDESSSSSPCTFATEYCDSDSLPSQEQSASAPASFHIDILEGEGALNNIRQRTAREPIVQVEDKNHKPVAGVLILFAVHSGTDGAGAVFDNASTLSVVSDADGRAVGRGFRPNQQTGSYTIVVTATLGSLTATTTIHESNTRSKENSRSQQNSSAVATPAWGRSISIKRVLLIESAVVALGVTTALLLNRTSGTTITAGTSTVGPAFSR